MLGPDSRLLPFLLVLASAALLVGAIRLRLLPVKVLCGMLSVMMGMVAGVAAVNYYYGYYTTWGAIWSDFNGGPGDLGVVSTASNATVESGSIGWVTLGGKLSGYSRRGLVYLPPQYNEARYAGTKFPVIELFHGSPGSPLAWETVLQIATVANALLAKHLMGPMVLVMPDIDGAGNNYQDCVNGPGVNDDTYLTQDVRDDILARYRVSHDPGEWGMSGYSSGGYCAANLALRHRGDFGAAAVIEGYFQAADGPAGAALGNNQALENANSPLYEAEALTASTSPLPAFWVAAGTNDKSDYQPATVFAAALQRIEQVPFIKLAAGDTANAWTGALPDALTWLWQQLASPDLRAQFPVRASDGNLVASAPVRPVPTRRPVACKPSPQPTVSLPCHAARAPAGTRKTTLSALAVGRLVGDRLLVELLNAVAEEGAVGNRGGVAALLVAADHAHDGAGARTRVEVGHPRAAAGAAGIATAVELQLGRALL
jgi:enterochelin esterase-like enzyme